MASYGSTACGSEECDWAGLTPSRLELAWFTGTGVEFAREGDGCRNRLLENGATARALKQLLQARSFLGAAFCLGALPGRLTASSGTSRTLSLVQALQNTCPHILLSLR